MLELQQLQKWLGEPLRSEKQLNELGEADCEIIDTGHGDKLCVTIDSIAEEYEIGLYRDPFTVGWMTATASASDLCAVGATAIGMLLSVQWALGMDQDFKAQFMQGFHAVSRALNIPLLGGDTSTGQHFAASSVGIGRSSRPIMRSEVQTGDLLVLLGQVGAGPYLSLLTLTGARRAADEQHYRPLPNFAAYTASEWFNASIDLSDGLINAVKTLSQQSGKFFHLRWHPQTIPENIRGQFAARNWPLFLAWLAEHGDYQQLVTIAPENLAQLSALPTEFYVIGAVDAALTENRFSWSAGEVGLAADWGQFATRYSLQQLSEKTDEIMNELRELDLP